MHFILQLVLLTPLAQSPPAPPPGVSLVDRVIEWDYGWSGPSMRRGGTHLDTGLFSFKPEQVFAGNPEAIALGEKFHFKNWISAGLTATSIALTTTGYLLAFTVFTLFSPAGLLVPLVMLAVGIASAIISNLVGNSANVDLYDAVNVYNRQQLKQSDASAPVVFEMEPRSPSAPTAGFTLFRF